MGLTETRTLEAVWCQRALTRKRTLGSWFERWAAYLRDCSVELPLRPSAIAAPPSGPSGPRRDMAFTVGRESRSSILSSVWSVSPSPLSAPTFRLLRPRANSVNARLLFHVGRVNLGAQRPVDPTFTRSVKVRSNTGRARWSAPTGCLRPG